MVCLAAWRCALKLHNVLPPLLELRSLDFDHPIFENRTVEVIILGIAGDHARCLRVNGDLSMEYADAAAERGDQIGRMKPFFHGAMRHPD